MSVQETSTDAQDDLVVQVRVNGESRRGFAEPRTLLSDFLRHELGLTGTHVGCEHGVCGACTVLIDGEPVRSCLMFAVQAGGKEIETVEGLAKGAEMHPENHALQCAFCTPGFLMTVSALLETNPDPSEDEIREYLSGNVCRCTGYVGIVAAVQSAAKKLRDQGGTADER
jgi:carbon-monoxide dehydrogenase small subunit